MATEITIIRHGETMWNVQKRIQGQRNSKLSENGITQAELVAEALVRREFDVLVSSDLERAVETAKIINKQLSLPHKYNLNLRERSFGIFEGKNFAEIEEMYPEEFRRYKERNPGFVVPGGESIEQMYTRVTSEIEALASKYKDQKVLIVSHGLVLEMMMYRTFNLKLDEPRSFSINNSSISSFYIDKDNWFLKEWGVIEHLVSLNVLTEL
ncbi:histidine phosphatase family protein [Draconibacterium sp. IB214405]|uniref:histidine phosphatase family protein n=1 Tax=Draconibacterium sp. IB214405 TaxID=3097352 RepID=UPI002A0F1FD1|nr:histidine phosphatase family protein [Draconibacterium sp. IB214405]MDX8340523.1 histidine phosphatase family protein [Draconibacterium sp. IB214405]